MLVSTPSKPPTPILPVRRKPERRPSTLGSSADSSSVASVPYPIPPAPPTLFSALRSLFLNISTNPGDKGTVAPRAFIDKLKELNDIFRSTMHQGRTHEFLNYLLNQIVEEIEEEKKRSQSGITGDDCEYFPWRIAIPLHICLVSSSVATLGSKLPPTIITAASSNSGTHPQDATLVHKLFEGGTHKRNTLLDVRNCMLLAFYVPPIVLPSSRYLPEMNRSWTSPLILNKTPVSRRVSDNLAQAKCFVKGISSFAIHVVTCKRLKKGTYQISQAYYGHGKTALLTRLHPG